MTAAREYKCNSKLFLAVVAVALPLSGCDLVEWNEGENRLISDSLKVLANASLKRGCYQVDEVPALYALNNILVERKSTHRIVMWTLPQKPC